MLWISFSIFLFSLRGRGECACAAHTAVYLIYGSLGECVGINVFQEHVSHAFDYTGKYAENL